MGGSLIKTKSIESKKGLMKLKTVQLSQRKRERKDVKHQRSEKERRREASPSTSGFFTRVLMKLMRPIGSRKVLHNIPKVSLT